MLQISIKILFFLSFVKCQTYNEIQNNPNNFHMFENFELTKVVYINESKLLNILKKIHENLAERKKHLNKLMENQKQISLQDDTGMFYVFGSMI